MSYCRSGLHILCIGVAIVFSRGETVRGDLWNDMDYGPFLTATIEVERDNIVGKGLAMRVDDGPGGVARGQAFVLYDTDTLTCSAGWLGSGFIDWQNVAFDGSHGAHSSLVGQRVFTNPIGPGWSNPRSGDWSDTRIRGTDGRCYGPLNRDWVHWRGLYQAGRQSVLSYSVGNTDVLEAPSLWEVGTQRLFVRTFRIGAREKDLVLQVAAQAGRTPSLVASPPASAVHPPLVILASPQVVTNDTAQPQSAVRFDGQTYLDIAQRGRVRIGHPRLQPGGSDPHKRRGHHFFVGGRERTLGSSGPVLVHPRWKTLFRYWLGRRD